MLLMPSIDLRAGRCVRLLHGDFAAETRYAIDPPALLERYAGMGASWLHVVDLDGARAGTLANRSTIAALAQARRLRLQVGGGARTHAVVADLFAIGSARVVVGSAAVEQAAEAAGWLSEFGPERLVLAFDVRLDEGGTPRLRTRGWTRATPMALWDAVQQFLPQGLRHVLCTDIARDGALAGPNLELYREAVQRFPQIQWQASGGIGCGADLQALAQTGAAVAISGKALLEGRLPAGELRSFLPGA